MPAIQEIVPLLYGVSFLRGWGWYAVRAVLFERCCLSGAVLSGPAART